MELRKNREDVGLIEAYTRLSVERFVDQRLLWDTDIGLSLFKKPKRTLGHKFFSARAVERAR